MKKFKEVYNEMVVKIFKDVSNNGNHPTGRDNCETIWDHQQKVIDKLELKNKSLRQEVDKNALDKCPITGIPFFMTIDDTHTYGGPYDSYTIPKKDDNGDMYRERFDHDRGEWVETEFIDLKIVITEEFEILKYEKSELESIINKINTIIKSSVIRVSDGDSVHSEDRRKCIRDIELALPSKGRG